MVETSKETQDRWKHIREHKYANNETPADWPDEVKNISLDGMALFGIGRSGEIYWDGQKLVTERRFSTFERGLAIAGLGIALIGVIATVVQAWAAVSALPH